MIGELLPLLPILPLLQVLLMLPLLPLQLLRACHLKEKQFLFPHLGGTASAVMTASVMKIGTRRRWSRIRRMC